MIGTIGGQDEGASYRLTPGGDGRATLVARGESDVALLSATLTGLLAAASPMDISVATADGRSVAIRGEAATLDGLALALFDDLCDRVDALGLAVAGVEIAGIVRSEDGLIGWGNVLMTNGPASVIAPLRVMRSDLTEHALTLRLERTAAC